MSEEKGLGKRLLGIFVETDSEESPTPQPGGQSPADLVAELAGQVTAPVPAAQHPPALALDKVQTPTAGAPTDFNRIFREAGMDAAELDRVSKAEDLLRSLPEGTPQPVKKQIVEASLRAFGFEVEKIILAAQNQKRALDAYVKVNESATAKSIEEAEAQIGALNEKMAALRADIERRTAQLGALGKAAQERKAQVNQVLEFFNAPAASVAGQS